MSESCYLGRDHTRADLDCRYTTNLVKEKTTPPGPNDFTGNVEMTWDGPDGKKGLGTQAESTWLQDGEHFFTVRNVSRPGG